MSDSEPPEESVITEVLSEDWGALRNRGDFKPMTKEALAAFVMGVCDDKIFTMHHIPEKKRETMTHMVFMPIALGAFAGYLPSELADIGSIWAYNHEAGPRSINGYPMFPCLRVITTGDWKKACIAIDRELARRKASVGSILDDLKDPDPV